MIITSKFGKFKLCKNYRDCFSLDSFEARYIPEVYDKFKFIVGDISADILRLKGFECPVVKNSQVRNIPIYLAEQCNFNTAYFILERINDEETQTNKS